MIAAFVEDAAIQIAVLEELFLSVQVDYGESWLEEVASVIGEIAPDEGSDPLTQPLQQPNDLIRLLNEPPDAEVVAGNGEQVASRERLVIVLVEDPRLDSPASDLLPECTQGVGEAVGSVSVLGKDVDQHGSDGRQCSAAFAVASMSLSESSSCASFWKSASPRGRRA